MGKYFGTDGVRGKANEYLTPELAMAIGRAGAYALAGHLGRPPKILIGADTRLSADMLEAALVAGLCAVGAEVHRAGVVPSPAMAFLVRDLKMDAGVMLSASHNPMPDNGIKFFDGTGYKLSDAVEAEIEALIDLIYENADKIPRPVGEAVGRAVLCDRPVERYVAFLTNTVEGKLPFAGMKVALDCANGATYQAAPMAFKKLGAKIIPMHYQPDGVNINANCGSTHLESLRAYVKANPVDIGLAFDGDGDRVLCVDETGAIIDGDVIMAICGLALEKQGRLKHSTIAATVMSNLGLELFCRDNGLKLLRTRVGDRYVIQEMKAEDYNLGGEQSGHIIFHDYNTTGDGVLTGLQLLAILKESGQKLSELCKVIEIMPQVLLGAELGSRMSEDEIKQNEKIGHAIRKLEAAMQGSGRVLVRPSGTEPLVRVMIEGSDQSVIQQQAAELVRIIEKELK
ncbi:MAG: phosphoglucosamine mutase [Defluviitaleaceae bacterium]|nr:phosphoglucosamine mutase [Defluviitaleaceae bacterium]